MALNIDRKGYELYNLLFFFILQFEGIMRILAVGRQILEPLEIMDLFLVSCFYIENEESTI